MIYFVQPIGGGPVKIGTTEDLDARLGNLESHYGVNLALLATLPGGREEEAAMHARFAHLRLGRTEQFRPAADLFAFIGLPLLVGINPDAVEAIEPGPKFLAIRGSREWREWVNRLADSRRLRTSDLVDQALVEYAERHGFTEPAPKR